MCLADFFDIDATSVAGGILTALLFAPGPRGRQVLVPCYNLTMRALFLFSHASTTESSTHDFHATEGKKSQEARAQVRTSLGHRWSTLWREGRKRRRHRKERMAAMAK